MFIFSTLVLIRRLWQLNTVVFMNWCLICAVLLYEKLKISAAVNFIKPFFHSSALYVMSEP